jgi:hypothetical protein
MVVEPRLEVACNGPVRSLPNRAAASLIAGGATLAVGAS